MDIKLELPEGQMQEYVSEALLRSLDEEKRDVLIKSAIQHLLSPGKGDLTGRGTSMLQDAFNMAVRAAAIEIVREEMKADSALRIRIADLYKAAIQRFMEADESEKLIERLVSGLEDAIQIGVNKDRY